MSDTSNTADPIANEAYQRLHDALRRDYKRRALRCWLVLLLSLLAFGAGLSGWLPTQATGPLIILGWLLWFGFLIASSWNQRKTIKACIAQLKAYSLAEQRAIGVSAQRSFFKQDQIDLIILRTLKSHYGMIDLKD